MRLLIIFLLILFVSIKANATEEKTCLALMMYKEANVESKIGQRAVLDVVYNRVLDSNKSACSVLKAKHQFSWVNRHTKWKLTMPMLINFYVVDGHKHVLDRRYKYFFNKRLHPAWARHMQCKTIGNHKFCRLNEK